MNKNIVTKIILFIAMVATLASCDPYEDYITDYKYSAVYFGTQKPLRTLVTRETSDKINFKLGVALAGLRENKEDQWVTFEIAPELLTTVEGANVFTLMPSDWYSFDISENKITIPKGKFLGDFTISVDKALFASDPLALTKKYAIPVRIVATSADSILRGDGIVKGKDYTILVLKYINENSGSYYARGIQSEYSTITQDTVAGTTKKYFASDWSKNKTRGVITLSLNECDMAGMGFDATEKLKVKFGADKAVTLSTSSANATIIVSDLGSSYNSASKEYHLVYTYVKSSKTYKIDEYLKLRNDPENDLRFEEW